jgi:hypothetical protein
MDKQQRKEQEERDALIERIIKECQQPDHSWSDGDVVARLAECIVATQGPAAQATAAGMAREWYGNYEARHVPQPPRTQEEAQEQLAYLSDLLAWWEGHPEITDAYDAERAFHDHLALKHLTDILRNDPDYNQEVDVALLGDDPTDEQMDAVAFKYFEEVYDELKADTAADGTQEVTCNECRKTFTLKPEGRNVIVEMWKDPRSGEWVEIPGGFRCYLCDDCINEQVEDAWHASD